mgnify:CR=1 FL=1
MNSYILKEATKMAMMTASIDDPKFENTDALTELIIAFYEDIEAFAQMLQFTPDEIENMDATTAEKLVSKYID